MSVLTVPELIARVQRQFGDESGVQVQTTDIIRWANDAQRECVMQHENLFQVTGYLNSESGEKEYLLPSNLLTLQSVYYTDTGTVGTVTPEDEETLPDEDLFPSDDLFPGITEGSGGGSSSGIATGVFYPLRYMSAKGLAEYTPGWDGDVGIPQWFSRGPSPHKLSLFPAPEQTLTGNIRIVYSRYSVDLVDETSSLDVPEYYHQYVLEYCLMKAYEMDENWEAADRKAQYIQSTLDFNNNREAWFGRESYPSIVPTSEDYF